MACSEVKNSIASFETEVRSPFLHVLVPADSTIKDGLSFFNRASHTGLLYEFAVHMNNTLNCLPSKVCSVFVSGVDHFIGVANILKTKFLSS